MTGVTITGELIGTKGRDNSAAQIVWLKRMDKLNGKHNIFLKDL